METHAETGTGTAKKKSPPPAGRKRAEFTRVRIAGPLSDMDPDEQAVRERSAAWKAVWAVTMDHPEFFGGYVAQHAERFEGLHGAEVLATVLMDLRTWKERADFLKRLCKAQAGLIAEMQRIINTTDDD